MAHWSSGYADFHEELYAQPPRPLPPPALPCSDCNETFTTLAALREHIFVVHPVAHPALLLQGRPCGDRRELIQGETPPADWTLTNCTTAQVNGVDIDPDEIGRLLSTSRGIVEVRLGNLRSHRRYEFDFAVADEADLHGVEEELARFIADGDISSNAISALFERTLAFPTARNYAGGITDYLYWLAGRGQILDATAEFRNRDKLNKAADVLRDIQRPAALAITSLISFHFNHFGESAHRALSPHLGAVSARLERMLAGRTTASDVVAVPGELSHLERLLADDRTRNLIELCSLPLTADSYVEVAEFDLSTVDGYDRVKAALFVTEHHLAIGDPRAVALVRAGSKNGLPDHWVNARLDCITDEGPPWNTAPAATTPVVDRTRSAHNRETTNPAKRSRNAPTTGARTTNHDAQKNESSTTAPSIPATSTNGRTPAGTTSASNRTTTPPPTTTSSEAARSRRGTAPTAEQPVPTAVPKTGTSDRTTGTGRSVRPHPAPPIFLEPAVPVTEIPEPPNSGRDSVDARTTKVADRPPWETSVSAPTFSSPTSTPTQTDDHPNPNPLLERLLPWRKSKSR